LGHAIRREVGKVGEVIVEGDGKRVRGQEEVVLRQGPMQEEVRVAMPVENRGGTREDGTGRGMGYRREDIQ